jgi:predicted nucleic acid-binding Zn ribbon protein
MSAEPLKECPECRGNLKRIIGTGAGAIFRGSGFYQTDYKNSKKNDKREFKPEPDKKKITNEKKKE